MTTAVTCATTCNNVWDCNGNKQLEKFACAMLAMMLEHLIWQNLILLSGGNVYFMADECLLHLLGVQELLLLGGG